MHMKRCGYTGKRMRHTNHVRSWFEEDRMSRIEQGIDLVGLAAGELHALRRFSNQRRALVDDDKVVDEGADSPNEIWIGSRFHCGTSSVCERATVVPGTIQRKV